LTTSGVHQAAATGVRVTPVQSKAEFAEFIELPYRLYAGNETWVPPLRRDVAHMLDLSHPFYQHAQREMFVARDANGAVVGRIAAIKNDAHNQQHHDKVGFFGFFESVRDPAVARALSCVARSVRPSTTRSGCSSMGSSGRLSS
jgi:hypothetical protein